MRRHISTTLLTTAVALLAAAAPAHAIHGDTGTHEVGHYYGAVGLTGDGGARGLVQLTSAPNGETRVEGMIIGILISVVQRLELVTSEQPCGAASGDEHTPIGPTFHAGADGTALLEEEGIYYFLRDLRRARSLAIRVAGEDGTLIACGALDVYAVRPSAREADAVIARGGRLDAGPAFLGHVAGLLDGTSNTLATFAGLEPEAPHALALSPRSCAELAGGAEPLAIATVGFRTGAEGTAHVRYDLQDVLVSALRDARSLAVVQGEEARPAACAPAHVASADRRPPAGSGPPAA